MISRATYETPATSKAAPAIREDDLVEFSGVVTISSPRFWMFPIPDASEDGPVYVKRGQVG
jgi:hypothetical protein